jgi:hypothetical protein
MLLTHLMQVVVVDEIGTKRVSHNTQAGMQHMQPV